MTSFTTYLFEARRDVREEVDQLLKWSCVLARLCAAQLEDLEVRIEMTHLLTKLIICFGLCSLCVVFVRVLLVVRPEHT
jgi:hypothetical protein